jgi:hypothetical protein
MMKSKTVALFLGLGLATTLTAGGLITKVVIAEEGRKISPSASSPLQEDESTSASTIDDSDTNSAVLIASRDDDYGDYDDDDHDDYDDDKYDGRDDDDDHDDYEDDDDD